MTTTSKPPFLFPKIYQFPPFFTRQVNERTWHSQLINWNALILAYCRYYRIFTLDISRTSTSSDNINNNGGIEDVLASSIGANKGSNNLGNNEDDEEVEHLGQVDGELFCNKRIGRGLKLETLVAIFEYMVISGTAAWMDLPDDNYKSKKKKNSRNDDDYDEDEDEDGYEQQYALYEKAMQRQQNGSNSNGKNSKSCIMVYWRRIPEWATMISEWVDNTGQNGSVLTLYELVNSDAVQSQEFSGLPPAILKQAVDVLVSRGKAVVMRDSNGLVAGLKIM